MILVMFSGGADSTLAAIRALKTREDVMLHHMVLKTSANRWEEEDRAADRVAEKLSKEYNNLTYTKSELDVRTIPTHLDSLHYTAMAATLASAYKDITEVQIGFVREDSAMDKPYTNRGFDYIAVVNKMSVGKARLTFPLINMSKSDVIEELGDYLVDTFSCRMPINGEECGRCTSCRAIKENKCN